MFIKSISFVNGAISIVYYYQNWDKMTSSQRSLAILNLIGYLPIPYLRSIINVYTLIIDVKTNGFNKKTLVNICKIAGKAVLFYYVPVAGQIYAIVETINFVNGFLYDETEVIELKGGVKFVQKSEWSTWKQKWTLEALNDFFDINIKMEKIKDKNKLKSEEELKQLVEERLNKTFYLKLGRSYHLIDISPDDLNFVDKIRFGLVNHLLFDYWFDNLENNLTEFPIKMNIKYKKEKYVWYQHWKNNNLEDEQYRWRWINRNTNLGEWTFLLTETEEQKESDMIMNIMVKQIHGIVKIVN